MKTSSASPSRLNELALFSDTKVTHFSSITFCSFFGTIRVRNLVAVQIAFHCSAGLAMEKLFFDIGEAHSWSTLAENAFRT